MRRGGGGEIGLFDLIKSHIYLSAAGDKNQQ